MDRPYAGRTEAQERADLARRVGGVAKIVENEVTAAQVVSALFAAASGFDEDLKAAKFVKNVGGPIGPAVSVTGAIAGYEADRRSGMPKDEALIKNGGGFVLGQSLEKLAGASGGLLAARRLNPAAVVGTASVMEYLGQWDGEDVAHLTQEGWRDTKAKARDIARTARQGITWANDPCTWVGRNTLGERY